MDSTDEKFVSQTLAGDRDAFGVLVHKYQEMVYTYAFHKTRNEADAQDIAQEVFLQAYRRLYQLRQPHLFRSWLYTIMSNECKRWLARVTKKRRREVVLEEATDEALQVEPAHAVPVKDWQVDLEQAMSALPDESRIAVSMFYMGDCSLKEISEFLGISINTVKSRLRRARQQLGEALSERYGGLLKSRKLKGGFLMQFMEQIRHIPAPAMGFAWSGATIGKSLFALITALCILIGLIGARDDAPTELATNQTGATQAGSNRLPIEVAQLPPAINSPRPSIAGIPAPTGKHTLGASSRAAIGREAASASNGAKPSNSQSSAAIAENAAEKLTFSGRVVDSEGEPVGDAEILYSVKYDASEPVERTKVDGTFRFESPRLEIEEWEYATIIATHPDYALGWRNLQLQNTAEVEIRLKAPGIISGRILNEDGEPIQNAAVQIRVVFDGNSSPFKRASALESDTIRRVSFNALSKLLDASKPPSVLRSDAIPISSGATNANGEFVLRGLPQGATTNLEIEGLTYAKELRFQVPVGAEGLEIRLAREARIEGHLSYTGTDAPVKNAIISAEGIYPTEGWEQAKVDVNGNYLVENLAPGAYNVYLEEGPVGWTAASHVLLQAAKGQTISNVDLTLVKVGFVTGQVTDRDTNEPIANHYLSLHDSARPEPDVRSHSANTDATGTYRFPAAPGPALVIATAPPGYQDVGQIRREVDVVEAETVVVDFQFTKGVELNGRILTEAGEPVARASVTDISDRHGSFAELVNSDENGEFKVRGLRTAQKRVLKAEHSGLRLRGTAEVEIHPDASVEIRMKPYELVRISGRVVNSKGKPIPSVNIDRMRWDPQRRAGSRHTVTVTDGEGWFHEVGLIVGDQYVILANAEGYREARTELFTAATEMTQIADLILQPAGGRFFIEGRITDTSGRPVAGARLVSSQQSQHWETLTDANGDYRLDELSMVVLYELEIYHPDYAHHVFEILKTNQRHDLVLVKADGYLAGRVVDADGNPIDRATVMIDPQEDPISGIVYPAVDTNGQGEFELEYIKDPTVSIYVGNDRGYRIFEDIKVNQRDLVFKLTPTGPRPEPTPEQQARWAYAEEAKERFKTLVGKPAPEMAVAEWLSGKPASIGTLKGKTIALYFWVLGASDNIQSIRLLNILREVYQEKGLVCVAICPAEAEVETIKQLIAENSLGYSIGLDTPTDFLGAKGETFDRYAVVWSSPIVLINAAGEITGSVYAARLEEQIRNLLAD